MFYLVALIGIGSLFFWRRTRTYAILGVIALAILWLFDKLVTEAPLDREYYEVRGESLKVPPSGGPIQLVLKLKNKHKTATLQSADVELIVQDCMGSQCVTLGREVQQLQFLARPGQVKQQSTYFYFENMAKPKGNVKAELEIVEVTGDW